MKSAFNFYACILNLLKYKMYIVSFEMHSVLSYASLKILLAAENSLSFNKRFQECCHLVSWLFLLAWWEWKERKKRCLITVLVLKILICKDWNHVFERSFLSNYLNSYPVKHTFFSKENKKFWENGRENLL